MNHRVSHIARSVMMLVLLFAAAACDSFVDDTDRPIDSIDDFQLDSEEQINFVIQGVQSRFSTTYDQIAVLAGGLSDEMLFDRRAGTATFPSFEDIDLGQIAFANLNNDDVYNSLGELRFFADDLLSRLDRISVTDQALRNQAVFVANFYGGVARYFYATYYGLNQTEGGGVISEDPDNPSPFTPSSDMYDLAIDKLTTALAVADDYHVRVINTIVARIELFRGNYAAASAAAQSGLVNGDPPFVSLHTRENSNYWWEEAGHGRLQWVVDDRFHEFVDDDDDEGARLPLIPTEGADGTTFYQQNLYPDAETPLPFATWQEKELILAEVSVRDGNPGDAVGRINEVRSSHGLDDLGSASIDTIIREREKELFSLGMRLVDQRRFDLWHLDVGTWQYFPLTQKERNQNPNF